MSDEPTTKRDPDNGLLLSVTWDPSADYSTPGAEAMEGLSYEDLTIFAREVLTNGACDMCGTDDWSGSELEPDGPTPHIGFATYIEGKGFSPTAAMPCWSMVCSNCGNVKLFSRFVIVKWKQRREEDLRAKEKNRGR